MKKLNIKPRQVVKFAAQAAFGSGASLVVKQVVANNVAPTNTYQKVGVVLGSFIIAAMVSEQANNYVNVRIDKVADDIAEARQQVEAQVIVEPEI